MITVTQLITRLYALLLRLYPRSFRAEFEEEVQAVFEDAVADAARRGGLLLAAVFLRELWDLPGALLREYRPGPGAKEANTGAARGDRNKPDSWRDAVLIGLPHLLGAAFGGVGQLAYRLQVFVRYAGLLALFGLALFVLAGGTMTLMFKYPVASLVPAALVVLVGVYVRARRADERSARRWLFFLFGVWALLTGAQLLAHRQSVLLPAMVGALVALLVHLATTPELWSKATVWITLSIVLASAALLVCLWQEMDPLLVVLAPVIALAWQAWEWRGKGRWASYLLLLLLLIAVGGWKLNPNVILMNSPEWVKLIFALVNIFIWPVVSVVLAARLVYASVISKKPANWVTIATRLALITLLLLGVGYDIMTERVWVRAEDSLPVLPILVPLAAIAAAMLLAWALKGWRRLTALAFVLLVTLSMTWASARATWMSPPWMTETRAGKIDQAIQKYHEHNGRYPSRLASLMPFYLWPIPQPMIFRDQTWCYEGGDDYYRLGYVYQPGFGWPEGVSIRIHAAVGEPPDPGWPCDEELERARSLAPW